MLPTQSRVNGVRVVFPRALRERAIQIVVTRSSDADRASGPQVAKKLGGSGFAANERDCRRPQAESRLSVTRAAQEGESHCIGV